MIKRVISKAEYKARGCAYCEDCDGHSCRFRYCPYWELDGYTDYRQYMKATGADTFAKMLREIKK
jgi:hypothetical protein